MKGYYRKFELILVSADNLPHLRSWGKMKVFAEVSLTGGPETIKKTTKRTITDMIGETNPRWNFFLDYTINDSSIVNEEDEEGALEMVVKLYCERTLGKRYIGEVKIPIKSLFDSGPRAENVLSYDVEGTEDGKLNILYSFRDKFSEMPAWLNALEVGVEMTRNAVSVSRRLQQLSMGMRMTTKS